MKKTSFKLGMLGILGILIAPTPLLVSTQTAFAEENTTRPQHGVVVVDDFPKYYDGMLVREEGKPTIYFIDQGKKRPISTEALNNVFGLNNEFGKRHYDYYAREYESVSDIPTGSILDASAQLVTFRSDACLCGYLLDKDSSGNTIKRFIPSPMSLSYYGFNGGLVEIPSKMKKQIPDGVPFHEQGAWGNKK